MEVEIGPGGGETLLAFAAATPTTNFFAIERIAGAAAAIMARAAERGLRNVRVIGADARCVVARLVPDASVAAYHLYFPDPWPKTRHRARRLASDAFARAVVRTLVRGGGVHVASDLPTLVEDFVAQLGRAGLHVATDRAAPRTRPVTSFERRYARNGTHYACLVRPARPTDGGSGDLGTADC